MEKKKLTFEQWCELNGKRWTGCKTFGEFSKNAAEYERYLIKFMEDRRKENLKPLPF